MARQKITDVPKPPEFDELVKDLNSEQRNEDFDTVPDWLDSFKERASRLGKSVKELLEDERKALRESNYPGPECLEPYELELYVKDALHDDRITHTRECVPCAALLNTAAPSAARLNSLIAEIRKEAEKSSTALPADRQKKQAIFSDAIATGVPILVSVWAALLVYWFSSQPTASEHIVNAVSWVVIKPALVALLALVVVSAVAPHFYKFIGSHGLVASSSGVLAVSIPFALLLFYATYTSLVSNTRKSEIELTLLQTQLAQAIASSVNTQEKNQDPARINFGSGPVYVQRTSNTPNEITYQATVRGVAGKLVAQVRSNTGELYWQPSTKKTEKIENEEVAKLVLGTVKSVDSENIALVDKSGLSHYLKLPREMSLPSRGERVLAVVEPTNLSVRSVHSISDTR